MATTPETKDTKKKTPVKKKEATPPLPEKKPSDIMPLTTAPLKVDPTMVQAPPAGMDQLQQLYGQAQMAGSMGVAPMAGSPGTPPVAGSPTPIAPPVAGSQTVDMSNAPYPNFSDMAQGDAYVAPGATAPAPKQYEETTSPYAPKNLSNVAPGDMRKPEDYPQAPFALRLMGAFLAPTRLGKIPDYIVQGIENKRTAMMEGDEKDFQHFMSIWKENPVAASQLAGTSMFSDMLQRKLGMNDKDLKVIQEIAQNNPMQASEMTQLLTSGEFVPEQDTLKAGGMNLRRNKAKSIIKVEGQERLYDAVTNKTIDVNMPSEQFLEAYREMYPNASKMEAMLAQMHFNEGEDLYNITAHNGNIVVTNKANPKDGFKINASDPDSVGGSKNVAIEEVKSKTGGTMGFWVVNKGAQYTDEAGNIRYQHYFVSLKDLWGGIIQEQTDKGNPPPAEPSAFRKWMMEQWDKFYRGFTGSKDVNHMDDEMISLLIKEREGTPQPNTGPTGGTNSPSAYPQPGEASSDVNSYIKSKLGR
jgi:hypothetical protein